MDLKVSTVLILICYTTQVKLQENAGNNLAKSLVECYKNRDLYYPYQRPPATMGVAIELIRKIENGPTKRDARQLSRELLHRFRQDGIILTGTKWDNTTIPLGPKGMQANKNILLLTKYIPGDAANFPNETLTLKERCALHFMLSNTVEVTKRGDEDQVCNRLSRYTNRVVRQARPPKEEVDIIQPTSSNNQNNKEPLPTERGGGPAVRKIGSDEMSECPLEGGVVYTKWGSVQLGTIIGGIAAGGQNQILEMTDDNGQKYTIDSIFATTLSGDIGEAAIIQSDKNIIDIGARGNWNSTYEPRYYFINRNENFEMTDAEIRADVDGFIFAKSFDTWRNKFSNIKISQILDMYYSQRGIFKDMQRACDRVGQVPRLLSAEELVSQTIGFALQYQDNYGFQTLGVDAIRSYTSKAIDKFIEYAKQMSDLKCTFKENEIVRAAADVVIVLDTTFEPRVASPILSYLFDALEVSPFGCNVTIINGEDGGLILNSTNSILDLYEYYNETEHFKHPRGFKYAETYNRIENLVKTKINEDRDKGIVGGKSTVFLLIPSNTPTDSDKQYITERLNYAKSTLPEFHIVVAGRASKDAYNGIVIDSTYDIFQINENTDGTNIASALEPVVKRIKEYPRRVSNPKCGADWRNEFSGNTMEEFIEPNTTNYYRIAPNYLWGEHEKVLKVRGMSGSMTVCVSDSVANPRENSTGNIDCKSLNNNEASYSLTGHCNEFNTIVECPAYYISVSAGPSSTYSCTDPGCRFPDNMKYSITVEGFECASGASAIYGSLIALTIALFVQFKFL